VSLFISSALLLSRRLYFFLFFVRAFLFPFLAIAAGYDHAFMFFLVFLRWEDAFFAFFFSSKKIWFSQRSIFLLS